MAVAAALVFASTLRARAQTPAETGVEHLSRVNSLDTAEMKPWHLKLAFSRFDDAGKPAGDGVVEEWWASPEQFRVEYTQGDHQSTAVKTPEGRFTTADGVPMDEFLELALAQVVHPISPADLEGAQPEVRQQEFGKAKLECTMLTRPDSKLSNAPLGLFPTFCAEGDALRLTWLFADVTVLTNRAGTFQGHQVPLGIEVTRDRKRYLEAHVVQLGTVAATAVDLDTSNLVKEPTGTVRISGAVLQKSKIGGPPPTYSENARRARTEGTVVLEVRIGIDGHVHALHVVSSPDVELATAALSAVQRWNYRPYLLNGVSTSVISTVLVNFNIRGFGTP